MPHSLGPVEKLVPNVTVVAQGGDCFVAPSAFGGDAPRNDNSFFALPTTWEMSLRGAALCAEAISPLHICRRSSEDFFNTPLTVGKTEFAVSAVT